MSDELQQSIGEAVQASADASQGTGAEVAQPAQNATAAAIEAALELPKGHKWTDEHKALFAELGGVPNGRKYQQFLNEAYENSFKSLQGDYTRKTQEIANFRRQWDQFQGILQPYTQHWQRNGISSEQGLQQILSWGNYLQSNPKQALLELSKMYQIDLTEAAQGEPYVDPVTQQLMRQVQELRSQLNGYQNNAQQQSQAQILETIKAFESAVDEHGNPKNPYFQDVAQDMIALLQSGRFDNLEDAYEYATNGNREVRARIAEEKAKSEAAKRAAEAQKAAAPAKTQATSKSGGSAVGTPKLSIRDAIRHAANQQT